MPTGARTVFQASAAIAQSAVNKAAAKWYAGEIVGINTTTGASAGTTYDIEYYHERDINRQQRARVRVTG
mgnify:FL=1